MQWSAEMVHSSFVKQYKNLIPELDTVQRWHKTFHANGTLFPELHITGRPRLPGVTEKVAEELAKNPKASTRLLAVLTGYDRETVKDRLIYDLQLEKVSTRYVPHDLTPTQKRQRVEGAKELLPILYEHQKTCYTSLLTGDESYLLYNYPALTQWLPIGSPRPVAARKVIDAPKKLLTVFFSGSRVWSTIYNDRGQMMSSGVFVDDVLPDIDANICEADDEIQEPVLVHFDNAPSHRSKLTQAAMKKHRFVLVPHPPYSPDLAPADFYLFGYLKSRLRGLDISTDVKLEAEVDAILYSLTSDELVPVFDEWIWRCEWVISHGGEYYRHGK
jgi:hypothetical protein